MNFKNLKTDKIFINKKKSYFKINLYPNTK